MRESRPATTTMPGPLVHGVLGTFQIALRGVVVLLPTVFANLHRFGSLHLLFVVCLLYAFWVVSGLLAAPLWHLRSWANLLVWALLALLLVQTVPIPIAAVIDDADPPLGASASILVEPRRLPAGGRGTELAVARFARRPGAAVGVLILAVAAAGLYWLVASATTSRKGLRRTTWAAVVGLGLLAVWMAMAGLGPPVSAEGVARRVGPALILGGDSLVPALLAALPLCLLVVLRPLGWMPRRHHRRRESRWGWLGRPAAVWAGIGLLATGLVAVALGLSNVPRHVLAVCVVLSVGFVLVGYVLAGPGRRRQRRPVRIALMLALWVVLMVAVGSRVGNKRVAATHADERLGLLMGAVPAGRTAFGLGAGSVSSRAVFGKAGWPVTEGDDADTNGYLVLRAELGWVGLVLALAAVAALGVRLVASWRRGHGPWSRTAVMVGLGALGANLLYFGHDAAALLTPNLLAVACVVAVVTAWAGHGAVWRPHRLCELGGSRWPLVVGAVGLLAAVGLAENEMLKSASLGTDLSDKFLHVGTFAVISLLLCYALGPHPTTRYLKTRILLAVLGTAALGVLVEFGQVLLTAGREFETLDIVANVLGAGAMGLLWWLVRVGQTSPPEPEPSGALRG